MKRIKISIAALIAAMLTLQFNIGLFPLFDNTVCAQETDNIIVSELVIWEDTDSINTISVGWNERETIKESIEKYQLNLYKIDTDSAVDTVEIAYQNNIEDNSGMYPEQSYDYEYSFDNVEYNQDYYCTIRWCDNEGNWSDFILSESIRLRKDSNPELVINTTDWTNNTTPQLTWSGVYLDTENEIEIQYQINEDEWQDGNWAGEAGHGKLDESIFKADGEYRIKVRGKSYIINEETGDLESVFTAESNEVVYKRDASAPEINITSPLSAAEATDKVKIVGTIIDGGSGISKWTLEYESNNNPDVWKEIDRGSKEIAKNQAISTWDMSDLQAGFYTIRLTVYDNDKDNSVSLYNVTVQKTDKSTLMVPINLSATLFTDTSISAELSWEFTQNPKETTYNIYRSKDVEFTEFELAASDIDSTYWIDKEIYYGETYYYKVTAVVNSKESKLSTEYVEVKLDRMLGLEDNWSYANFTTDKGKGYINLANGNLVYKLEDSIYTNLMEGFSFSRVYNSQSDMISAIGYGWDFSFSICLYQEKDTENNLRGMILKDGDGSFYYFTYDSLLGKYVSPEGLHMALEYNNRTSEHILTIEDSTVYTFSDDLKLVKIANDENSYINLQYDISGKLTSIENNFGEQIILEYYQNADKEGQFYTVDIAHAGLLAQMTDIQGKSYVYEYLQDQAILSMVSLGTTSYRERYYYVLETYQISNIVDTATCSTAIEYAENQNKTIKIMIEEEIFYELEYEENITYLTDVDGKIAEYNFDDTIYIDSEEINKRNNQLLK